LLRSGKCVRIDVVVDRYSPSTSNTTASKLSIHHGNTQGLRLYSNVYNYGERYYSIRIINEPTDVLRRLCLAYRSIIPTGGIYFVFAMVFHGSSALFHCFSQVAAHLRDWSSVYMPALCEPEDDADEDAAQEKHAAPVHRSGGDRRRQRPAVDVRQLNCPTDTTLEERKSTHKVKNQSGRTQQKAATLIGNPSRPSDHSCGGNGAP
jgi:hypothetical protein